MRTTINIDDDVLAAAQELARDQKLAVGAVVSRLLRKALTGGGMPIAEAPPGLAGFRPLPSRGKIVTNETVNRLRDEEGV